MAKIISLIIKLLNIINKISFKSECFLMKFLPKEPATLVMSEQYRKFKVDPVPFIKEENLPISFDEAVEIYKSKHKGRSPKPINRRVPLNIPKDTVCPHCGAPYEYLYDNKSGKISKQCRCKVCDTAFVPGKPYIQQVAHYCPYCGVKLDPRHTREHFTVYRCPNNMCTYYKHNLRMMNRKEKKLYKRNPSAFKLHYITRVFSATIEQLERLQATITPSKVQLSRIHNSKHILGLILTYHINYGLSLRKTALIMREVHDVKVSHQTVANYAEAASCLINPWLDNYQYDNLTVDQCGDETYVKVKGKKAYVFFMCDSVRKIITSYNIFMKRDTFSAIQAFYSVIRKFTVIPEDLPEDLNFVVDGNPIYLAAQQYLHINKIRFKVHQVIGLENKDETSKMYRSQKQIIERLNRTFKFSYYVKNGFTDFDKANEFMCLFTTYFNFLRNHSSLKYKPPVELEAFKGVTNMPKKWNMIIDMANDYITNTTIIN